MPGPRGMTGVPLASLAHIDEHGPDAQHLFAAAALSARTRRGHVLAVPTHCTMRHSCTTERGQVPIAQVPGPGSPAGAGSASRTGS